MIANSIDQVCSLNSCAGKRDRAAHSRNFLPENSISMLRAINSDCFVNDSKAFLY